MSVHCSYPLEIVDEMRDMRVSVPIDISEPKDADQCGGYSVPGEQHVRVKHTLSKSRRVKCRFAVENRHRYARLSVCGGK